MMKHSLFKGRIVLDFYQKPTNTLLEGFIEHINIHEYLLGILLNPHHGLLHF